jgi:hypothetical protein
VRDARRTLGRVGVELVDYLLVALEAPLEEEGGEEDYYEVEGKWGDVCERRHEL